MNFGMDDLFIVFLIAVAAAGFAYALLHETLSLDGRRAKRFAALRDAGVKSRTPERTSKRTSVEDALRELEERKRNAKSPPLNVRLAQAGLTISRERFLLISAAAAGFAAFFAMIMGFPLYVWIALGFLAGWVMPRFVLSFLAKRRINNFLDALPDAVDIIVRGVKAGLPLGDCLRIVASEARDPVRGEFLHIMHQQGMGKPLYEAINSLYDRTPLAETSFFCIVISIQQKAGGNLSESLSNLSKVLRERKKMKAKVQAMSQEAKSSAAIIGALPIIVGLLVYMTSPDYISLLWKTDTGHYLMVGCALWMGLGVFIMKQMIDFEI